MRLPKCRRNLNAWQAKAVRLPRAFSFDHPKRELRKPFFHIGKMERRKIEIHGALRFGRKLFCHQRLPARHGFPIDVTLGLARHIGTYPRKIVACSKVLVAGYVGDRARLEGS